MRSILEPHFVITDTTQGANGCLLLLGNEQIFRSCGGSVSFKHPGMHKITQIVENNFGCFDTAFANVYVEDRYSDRDGKNETFYPVVGGVSALVFEIYDRWGNRIFETNMPQHGWDGTHYHTGKEYPSGVYIYRVVCTDAQGESQSYTGEINLIR
jgi:gliding motility-associated-like protein